jgi:single-stranded DNA-binding protein
MPSIATASVVGHLYRKPEIKTTNNGASCLISFWTADKVKGEETKQFTSWSGWVNGPQAEWLATAEKGSPVFVSGTIRYETRKDKDGKEHHGIAFTRINECRCLDERKDARDENRAVTVKPSKRDPVPPATKEEEIPF